MTTSAMAPAPTHDVRKIQSTYDAPGPTSVTLEPGVAEGTAARPGTASECVEVRGTTSCGAITIHRS
ncbi:hypothetical protein GCM10023169_09400 [Georgenia halophila]|uniref:Uncharacterized protein n=1 Tax=Georgenia halophila TaxID=620889 RepID=A0ABP8KYY0_9MICO